MCRYLNLKWILTFVSFVFIEFIALISPPPPAHALISGEYDIYPLGTISGINSGLTADAEGNIWFVDLGFYDRIGRVNPNGSVTQFSLPTAGTLTGGITLGPDGLIWYTKEFSGIIGRLSPDGSCVEYPVDISNPSRITTGPDGNLWFTGSHSDGQKYIGKMTTGGALDRFALPLVQGFPVGITAGPDGQLWFAVAGANKIGKVTTYGAFTFYDVSGSAFDITTGSDGNLWFTAEDKIGRIAVDGNSTMFPIPTAGSFSYGIAPGPDGNIWYANYGNNSVGRITTAGVFLPEIKTYSEISAPQGIVKSPDGMVWFTYSNYNKIGFVSLMEISNFFPLTDGSYWSYQFGTVGYFSRTVSPGTFVVNQAATKRIVDSDGVEAYYTNDANGIREHKEYDPEPPSASIVFSPPSILGNSSSVVGVPLVTTGTVTGFLGTTPFSVPYNSTSTAIGLETVTLPAGKFKAVKFDSLLNFGASIAQTAWIAKDIGVVKIVADTGTYELTGTNISDTEPDPFWFIEKYGVRANDLITSGTMQIMGITAPADISVSGGEYKIGNGSFTALPGKIANGQTVTVRLLSGTGSLEQKKAALTIGGMTAEFKVTTAPQKSIIPSIQLLLFN